MNSKQIQLRDWHPESGGEPVVRIGVMLNEDAIPSLQMQLDDAEYILAAGDDAGGRSSRRARLSASRCGAGGVSVALDDHPPRVAQRWTIAPLQRRPQARGVGVRVNGIVAGRGFHWHKRVDQTLAGRLDLLPGERGLVLVNELPLEAYLAGVITSEMSSACPIEFFRAQCITARSWLLALAEPKHDGEPFDRCNDDCCQRYQGTDDLTDVAIEAVESTRGQVLVADGGRVIVDANYSKSCGGIVEMPEQVWGVHKPGLGPLVDAPPGSEARRFMPVTEANLQEYLQGNWLAATDVYCSPRRRARGRAWQVSGPR